MKSKIRLGVLYFLAIFVISPMVSAQTPGCIATKAKPQCTLIWTPNTEADMKEYRLYYGSADGVWDGIGSPVVIPHPTVTASTEKTLPDGRYFIAATAVDMSGNESPPTKSLVFVVDLSDPSTPVEFQFKFVEP